MSLNSKLFLFEGADPDINKEVFWHVGRDKAISRKETGGIFP